MNLSLVLLIVVVSFVLVTADDEDDFEPEAAFPAVFGEEVQPKRVKDSGNRVGGMSFKNAWEESGLLEGDIAFPKSGDRAGLLQADSRWSNGIVPVFVNKQDFTTAQLTIIQKALDDIEAQTCIQFKQFDKADPSFVKIIGHKNGCYSLVGKMSGGQELNLQSTPGSGPCITHGIVIHEIMHALGILHEHNSPNRDQYVKIHYENVRQSNYHDFEKGSLARSSSYGLPYDYSSLMHYSQFAFSMNSRPTITPLDSTAKIGQNKKMSNVDVQKINLMYSCNKSKKLKPTTTPLPRLVTFPTTPFPLVTPAPFKPKAKKKSEKMTFQEFIEIIESCYRKQAHAEDDEDD